MGEVDAPALLDGFTSWAGPHLPPGDDYVLLTQRELLGNTVGQGWIGRTCTAQGVAVVQATSTHARDAVILSHELGHNLGMRHDASSDYVMSPSTGAPLATTWSAQSSTELAAYLAGLGATDCLNNVPEPDLGARCGDGIQDAGEQCDCGSNDCTGIDPCCNGAACQLWPGAECSDVDGCCNACQVLAQGTVCEPATPCQPAGICSGQSGKCFAPAPYENGTACTVAGFSDGRCLQGKCLSRDQQCDARTSGTVACPSGTRATSCSDLACITPGAPACHAWIKEYEQPPKVLEGSTCGDGQQCYQGTCIATSTIPRCENGLPVNACGGCSSLAMQPGVPCNGCGVSECFGGGVVCSNAACLDGFECLSGICSPIDACKAGPCQIGEVCRSTGPGSYVCEDLDECSSQNGGCDPRVSCTNARGGRVCGALDACHPAYLCPASTTSCPLSTAPDGTACNDQNACTTADLCVAGACVGSDPVVCAAASACQLPGTCNPSTGTCGVPVPDPRCAHCSDGVKNAGELAVDCGGGDCLACAGSRCTSNAECASGLCKVNQGGGKGAQCTLR
jgi:hypothetical protein